jgi:hypothetical protein
MKNGTHLEHRCNNYCNERILDLKARMKNTGSSITEYARIAFRTKITTHETKIEI